MSRAGDEKPRRRRRPLTDDEQALWRGVTREIAPLRRPPRREPSAVDDTKEALAPDVATQKAATRAAAKPPPKKPAVLSPLAPLGRRGVARVARGKDTIDGRIDLHGMTQRQAHAALKRFLHKAQADGAKLVLVITGKGARGADGERERGVLRRQVPEWLALAEFRPYVLGLNDASVRHGGEGALYVQVRRVRTR